MNSEMMFSAISDIADEFIVEAEQIDRSALVKIKHRRVYRIAACAAALAASISLAIGLGAGLYSNAPVLPGDSGNDAGTTPPGMGTIGSKLSNSYGNVLLKSVDADRFTFVVEILQSSDSFVWEYEISGYYTEESDRFVVALNEPLQNSILYIPAAEVLRVFVNGSVSEDCMLPQTTGEYEIVVDCSRLNELYSGTSLIRLTVGGLKFSLMK